MHRLGGMPWRPMSAFAMSSLRSARLDTTPKTRSVQRGPFSIRPQKGIWADNPIAPRG